ncbi:ankyrin repeat domain-containing protein [Dendryphion nanum]|uniref:Ankyrin repeat domain-containing protein n=1 Tax=Dendryphion nanum TaxID=256645 RepID=A0A9P9EJ78_9PLEO|nr:ankyrin repeat domain-containing protein [Dendryphion nanum]
MATTLLKMGAGYEAKNRDGKTAAELAISATNIPVAVAIIGCARGKRNRLAKEKEMLLKHVEKARNQYSMNNELIADIFEAGCDPDSTVLVEAIKRNDTGLAAMFLEKGADPNRRTATGVHPIFAALDCASAQMVQLLLKHGADVQSRNAEGLVVLQAALESYSAHDKDAISGIFDSLLSNGADPKVLYPDGRTLLHAVVSSGLSRAAQWLLQHEVGVDVQDKSGSSALHLATQGRSCIEVLLKHGADVHQINHKGLTPLLSVILGLSKDSEPDLEPLIKVSDLRKTDKDQKTALHLAAERGLDRTIRSLLRYRAETTIFNKKNQTPLLLAVLAHQWSIIPLLSTQPGINSWDENAMTALHHMSASIPRPPTTWQNISAAVMNFCVRGVSRSMRDRSGATPLIHAVKSLPEEGLPLIEALLKDHGKPRSNCIGHEDHKQKSALYHAGTLQKPVFVEALLKHGAPFSLNDWPMRKGPIEPNTTANKQILRLLVEYDWLRRAIAIQRNPNPNPDESILPSTLPESDLRDLIARGLDLDALPTPPNSNRQPSSLLWVILNASIAKPPPPISYIHSVLSLLISSKINPNLPTTHSSNVPFQPLNASSPANRATPKLHYPLSFLLEHHPTIDIDTITLFLPGSRGPSVDKAPLNAPSTLYASRTPLHSAILSNRLDIVDELLTRGADPNPTDDACRTPLFLAAELGLWEIAENLLRCGASISSKDKNGASVLHAAVRGGSAKLVANLLRKGANTRERDGKGFTPTDLVAVVEGVGERERGRIARLLEATVEEERAQDTGLKNKKEKIQGGEGKMVTEDRSPSGVTKETNNTKLLPIEKKPLSHQLITTTSAKAAKPTHTPISPTVKNSVQYPQTTTTNPTTKSPISTSLPPPTIKPSIPIPTSTEPPAPPTKSTISSFFSKQPSTKRKPNSKPKPNLAPISLQPSNRQASNPLPSQPQTTIKTSSNLRSISNPTPIPKLPLSPLSSFPMPPLPSPPPDTHKPLPSVGQNTQSQPRIDSGFGHARPETTDTKPLPPLLDRTKKSLDEKKRDSTAEELSEWLKLSKMMGGL